MTSRDQIIVSLFEAVLQNAQTLNATALATQALTGVLDESMGADFATRPRESHLKRLRELLRQLTEDDPAS